jgi:hypothetical protein
MVPAGPIGKGIRNSQKDDLDKLDAYDVVLVGALQVDNDVEQLFQKSEYAIPLEKRLEACEESKQQFELGPPACIE